MHSDDTILNGKPIPALSGLDVLLVEDEFLIAVDAEDILRTMGAANIQLAGTYEAAHKSIEEGRFDVVILDVNINGKMSFPLGEMLKARGIPFVFATGYTLEGREQTGLEGSIYLTKPYTPQTLEERISMALARGSAATAKAEVAKE